MVACRWLALLPDLQDERGLVEPKSHLLRL
jgi:hypothetical protein